MISSARILRYRPDLKENKIKRKLAEEPLASKDKIKDPSLDPIVEGENLDPIVEGENLDPIVEGENLDPIVEGENLNPIVEGENLNPIVEGENLDPIVEGENLNPIVEGENLNPIVEGENLNPIVEGENLNPIENKAFGNKLLEKENKKILEDMKIKEKMIDKKIEIVKIADENIEDIYKTDKIKNKEQEPLEEAELEKLQPFSDENLLKGIEMGINDSDDTFNLSKEQQELRDKLVKDKEVDQIDEISTIEVIDDKEDEVQNDKEEVVKKDKEEVNKNTEKVVEDEKNIEEVVKNHKGEVALEEKKEKELDSNILHKGEVGDALEEVNIELVKSKLQAMHNEKEEQKTLVIDTKNSINAEDIKETVDEKKQREDKILREVLARLKACDFSSNITDFENPDTNPDKITVLEPEIPTIPNEEFDYEYSIKDDIFKEEKMAEKMAEKKAELEKKLKVKSANKEYVINRVIKAVFTVFMLFV